ncbi:ABC transporter ATP-binding protein [Megasphaera vaginalis (ex Srinivasan et al. 2021)]|uniref:ABC-type quaternary amine transporter n=1 Tax=Megasphaera vaginalis (ex Srinivasan et al. 2021) TaxID=1111454 RepID=U7UVC8_9FIRM|nr:ABC transporter ATP-binding protein [Megasphaera vaginalis (ex Srinivasan et al. 2021)]ERT62428.1 ABC transporter, ATP-binding protein [Megasphaera vaginalis (ex Srinivasan et al. 2021)]
MIEFRDVSKTYGNTTVLSLPSLTINDGDFFVLVGPSGSGKTTTLKLINRLLDPSRGEITIDGKKVSDYPLRELRLHMGYVLQQIALFPNLTVEENIGLVPTMKGWTKAERLAQTTDWLEKAGLSPALYSRRYPRELSGGEQQRVGIIRALIGKPKIVLMDEPFSALDPLSRRQLQNLVKALHRELGLTIVFVTHDLAEAAYLGNHLAIMESGKIVQIGTPDELRNNPKNTFVSRFFHPGGSDAE